MPEVSVIIPNYNHAFYLKQRIDSVLNQGFKDFELIILDDCSTDSSQSIIYTYKDHPQIGTIVINEVNSGSTYLQWQKGVRLARGKWIWIAESDDWCEPTFLDEMMQMVKGNPKIVLSYCQSTVFSDNKILYKTSSDFLAQYYTGRDWIAKNMLGDCSLLNASMAIFKRTEAIEILNHLPNLKQCGDWFFWCMLAQKGHVGVSGRYLNYFRKHAVNVTENNWSKGYFFTEGSFIFLKLKDELGLTQDEIREGLHKFFTHLGSSRPFFSLEKYQELKTCISNVDPLIADKLLTNYNRVRRKKQIINSLKKPLRFISKQF